MYNEPQRDKRLCSKKGKELLIFSFIYFLFLLFIYPLKYPKILEFKE